MRRILYVTDFLMPGGIERQLTELVIRLDRKYFQPEVICLYGSRWGVDLHFASMLQTHDIPLHILNLGRGPFAKLNGIRQILTASWRTRTHIIHALNYHSNLLTRFARPLLLPSVRLLGTIRNEYTPKQLRNERLTQRACTHIVCNSPHLRQLLIEAGIPEQKLIVIQNGIDIKRFTMAGDSRRESGRTLLFMGRISHQKSPHLIVEALGYLKQNRQLPENVRLLIVGPRHEDESQHLLDDAIHRHDLQGIVAQLPATDQPENFYHDCDVFVLPSLYEGLSNVLLEALAAGKPVIISDKANATGVVEHGMTGWIVRTGDQKHLARTIATVVALPEQHLEDMRSACQQRAAEFSVEQMVERYQHLYEHLTVQGDSD